MTEELTGDFLRLNDAIRYFAPPELMAEFDRRMALPEPQPPGPYAYDSEVVRHTLFVYQPWHDARRYLFDLLFYRRLEAWGIMREPKKCIQSERIPSEMFDDATMGWKENVIKRFGYCYSSVVVKLPQAGEAPNRISIPSVTALPQPPEAGMDSPPDATPLTSPPFALASSPALREKDRKGLGGRPPVVEKIRSVIRELKPTGALDNISKKRMHDVIRHAAREKHPDLFPTDKQPGPDKIREALKAEME